MGIKLILKGFDNTKFINQAENHRKTLVNSRLFILKVMKLFKNYILRPFIIILCWVFIFSFIAGTIDITKWSIWLRFFSVIVLFYAFIVTERE